MRAVLLLTMVPLFAACLSQPPADNEAPGDPPPLTLGPVTPITHTSAFAAEPHVAIRPQDPDVVVAASADYRYDASPFEDIRFEIVIHRSQDSGATWESRTLPASVRAPFDPSGSMNGVGDPVLAYAGDGTLFLAGVASQAVWKEVPNGPPVIQLSDLTVFVTRSTDNGATWSEALFHRQGAGTFGFPVLFAGVLEDKPWVTTGRDGSVHVSWTEFLGTQSAIRYARSPDNGDNWEEPLLLAISRPGTTMDGPTKNQMSMQGSTVSAASAVVYVSATEYPITDGSEQRPESGGFQILWTSTDGGRTFGAPVRAGPATFARYGQVVAHPTDAGRVAIVAPTDSEDSRVYLIESRDRGATWTKPLFLSGRDGIQQHPTAVWTDDRLLIAFYDAGWADGERVSIVLADASSVIVADSVPDVVNPGPYRREYFGLAGHGEQFSVAYVGGDQGTKTWTSHVRIAVEDQ